AIRIEPKSRLHRLAKKQTIQVNSSHHQSVKVVPSTLQVTAVSSDGVIEAFESTSHPFWVGVQWHPEFLYRKHPIQKRLFSAFVQAAKRFNSQKGN
ncbi:MAG: C26 family cysteine hydrolase domain-containing family, partial [Anaerolineae bacterium]|nr:C26 family cysteine hydrolase domain-containing family [Anaerolineae bacterium]